jgi:hypothetical protein
MLKDDSYDFFSLSYEDHRQALFRYYTRFLLVIAEMLNDFEEIVERAKAVNQKEARRFLSRPGKSNEVSDVFAFINTVCNLNLDKK